VQGLLLLQEEEELSDSAVILCRVDHSLQQNISCYNNSVVSSVISYCCSSVTLCKHIVQSATLLRFDASSVCTSAKEVKCFLIG